MINRTKYNSKTSKGPLVAEWNKCQARFVEEIALLQLHVLRYARRTNSRKYSDVINKEQAFLKSKWYMWIKSKGPKGISPRLWSLWYLIRTLTTGVYTIISKLYVWVRSNFDKHLVKKKILFVVKYKYQKTLLHWCSIKVSRRDLSGGMALYDKFLNNIK